MPRDGRTGPADRLVTGPRSKPDRSTDRHAFPRASLNVRPMAMTSPTDFMVEVSAGSVWGNFSNANRGTFTTT